MTELYLAGFLICFTAIWGKLLQVPTTRDDWLYVGITGAAMLAFAYLLGGAG